MSASIDVKGLLGVSWRRVGVPLLGLCAGLAAAQGVTQLLPARYEAEASVLVSAEQTADDRPADLALAQNLTPTIARLVGSREVALDAARALGLPERAVLGHVSGEYELGLQIITVHASAATGTQAAAIANAASRAVSQQLGRLDMGGSTSINARVLDTASPPALPAFPKPLLNGVLGALAGLLAGWGATMLRDRFDSRLRAVGQIEARLGLPVVGVLPKLPRRFARHHAAALYARTDVADAVRAAISTLSVLTAPLPRRRLLVTSAHDDDGKALVTALLGLGLADEHCRATLVDGAVRDPVLSGHFPEAPHTWQQVLTQQCPPVRLADFPTLTVLPAEPREGADTEALHELGGLLNALGEDEDCVLVHAPPILAGREIAAFAQHADGVLLVVRAGRTDLDDSTRAARLVQRLGLPLAGVVVIGAVSRTDHRPDGGHPAPTPGLAADTVVLPTKASAQGAVIRELVSALIEDNSGTPGRHRRQGSGEPAGRGRTVEGTAVERKPVTQEPTAQRQAVPEPVGVVPAAEAPAQPTRLEDAITEQNPAVRDVPEPSEQAPTPGEPSAPAAPVWGAPAVVGALGRPLARPERTPSAAAVPEPSPDAPAAPLADRWPVFGQELLAAGRPSVERPSTGSIVLRRAVAVGDTDRWA
ncbi:hypothetical protein O7634_27390 [Micromonospora sp. WMMD1120]|uniref:hypothetical protein n=1 Tax=Micromonospora sp. WMMD1120 TaxID=3016106 RepID=UPI0024177A4A|nr:hypothetical protein [Micromonospora sp. WMMD1120]MDG4810495.1 hypothetical protein [Micromonospora sp. WMMD1120]